MADLTFNENGGTQDVSYSITCDGTVAGTSSDVRWLTVNVTRTNSTSGKINVTAGANSSSQRTGVITLSVNGQTCTQNTKKINVVQAAGGGGGCSGVNAVFDKSSKTWNNNTTPETFTLSTGNENCPPVITNATSSDTTKFTVTKTNTTVTITPVGDTSTNFNGTCSVQYTVNGESRNPRTITLKYIPGGGGSCTIDGVSVAPRTLTWGSQESGFDYEKEIQISTQQAGCLTSCTATITAGTSSAFSVSKFTSGSWNGYGVEVYPKGNASEQDITATLKISYAIQGGQTGSVDIPLVRRGTGGGGDDCSTVNGSVEPNSYTWNGDTTTYTFSLSSTNPNCILNITNVTSSDATKFTVTRYSNVSFVANPVGGTSSGYNGTCSVQYTVNGESRNPITVRLEYVPGGGGGDDCTDGVATASQTYLLWTGSQSGDKTIKFMSPTDHCYVRVKNVTLNNSEGVFYPYIISKESEGLNDMVGFEILKPNNAGNAIATVKYVLDSYITGTQSPLKEIEITLAKDAYTPPPVITSCEGSISYPNGTEFQWESNQWDIPYAGSDHPGTTNHVRYLTVLDSNHCISTFVIQGEMSVSMVDGYNDGRIIYDDYAFRYLGYDDTTLKHTIEIRRTSENSEKAVATIYYLAENGGHFILNQNGGGIKLNAVGANNPCADSEVYKPRLLSCTTGSDDCVRSDNPAQQVEVDKFIFASDEYGSGYGRLVFLNSKSCKSYYDIIGKHNSSFCIYGYSANTVTHKYDLIYHGDSALLVRAVDIGVNSENHLISKGYYQMNHETYNNDFHADPVVVDKLQITYGFEESWPLHLDVYDAAKEDLGGGKWLLNKEGYVYNLSHTSEEDKWTVSAGTPEIILDTNYGVEKKINGCTTCQEVYDDRHEIIHPTYTLYFDDDPETVYSANGSQTYRLGPDISKYYHVESWWSQYNANYYMIHFYRGNASTPPAHLKVRIPGKVQDFVQVYQVCVGECTTPPAPGLTVQCIYITNNAGEVKICDKPDDFAAIQINGGEVLSPVEKTYSGLQPNQLINVRLALNDDSEISLGMFHECSGLTNITIPNTVTKLDKMAFRKCTSLTSVNMQEGLLTIGEQCFEYCENLAIMPLPNTVTNIGKMAFADCENLSLITIPAGVTVINDGTFENCDKLTSFTISDTVTSIGKNAFSNSGLKEIIIPDSVTSIGKYAFSLCGDLTAVTLSNSITSIDDWTFLFADIKSVTIPKSVTSIGKNAFQSCVALTSVTFEEGSALASIGEYAFSFTGIKSITIPNTVTSIGKDAFDGCKELTGLTLSNTLATLGEAAFYQCSGLTSVTIPDSLAVVSKDSFGQCFKLTTLNLGTGVNTVGQSAFGGCSGLTSITIPGNCKTIESSAFRGCSSVQTLTISEGVESIGKWAFSDCTSLTGVTIPKSVTSIGSGTFSVDTGITTFTVTEGNTKYDSRDNCKAIIETASNKLIAGCKNTTIPSTVTTIGGEAFNNVGLTSITIPGSVTRIDGYAFWHALGLTTIEIPASVASIGAYGLAGCPNLTVTINAENPITTLDADNVFDKDAAGDHSGKCILVPSGKVETYKAADKWSTYASRIKPIGSTDTCEGNGEPGSDDNGTPGY